MSSSPAQAMRDDDVLLTLAQKVDSSHTALLVIDVQNDFCASGGFFDRTGSDVTKIQTIIPRLQQFLTEARETSVPVIFIAAGYGEAYLSSTDRISAFFAKDSWLRANADAARRLKRAVDRATAFMNDGPKEERLAWVSKFTSVRAELVERMTLPLFTTELNVESLQANVELAASQGLTTRFDVKAMVWKP